MPKIIQLSPHIANLIAAGEVVERPASVVKELIENAVDAGASCITVEIQDGGMTFLRVTDDGCGMEPEDVKNAFLRHATSKLRTAEDLAAIGTMGFRGEALAAIASVSRIDIMTKSREAVSGVSLHLDAGTVTEESEAGCPVGTTIIVRDLFYNTPARMKFMKADTVEGSKVSAAVQMQALAHPDVSFRFLREGKEILSTTGDGDLRSAVYSVYGSDGAKLIPVDSKWEKFRLTGFVSKPTDARPSRNLQTYFVNGRPVKSRLMISAFEEAYRNQIMVGKFPVCVLHLTLPANAVDVNVHPAKTEVKFLNEKAVFDCIHYGVLGALNKASDRPAVQFAKTPSPEQKAVSSPAAGQRKQESFFRTMTPQEYKNFTEVIRNAPKPDAIAAGATAAAIERRESAPVRQNPVSVQPQISPAPVPKAVPVPPIPEPPAPEPVQEEQAQLPLPAAQPWKYIGELYDTYIIVQQGEDAFLIDKHAAHERILFEKLKANQEQISAQTLLRPITCRLSPEEVSVLLSNREVLHQLGFDADEFGDNILLVRQVPMDLAEQDIPDALCSLAADLLNGRRENADTVRDTLLHTVACKAAIKAGWHTDEKELLALVRTVMEDESLKYCPHGRPICVSLSKKQLEKQFKRS